MLIFSTETPARAHSSYMPFRMDQRKAENIVHLVMNYMRIISGLRCITCLASVHCQFKRQDTHACSSVFIPFSSQRSELQSALRL